MIDAISHFLTNAILYSIVFILPLYVAYRFVKSHQKAKKKFGELKIIHDGENQALFERFGVNGGKFDYEYRDANGDLAIGIHAASGVLCLGYVDGLFLVPFKDVRQYEYEAHTPGTVMPVVTGLNSAGMANAAMAHRENQKLAKEAAAKSGFSFGIANIDRPNAFITMPSEDIMKKWLEICRQLIKERVVEPPYFTAEYVANKIPRPPIGMYLLFAFVLGAWSFLGLFGGYLEMVRNHH